MRNRSVAAYEEDLLPALLEDIAHGAPDAEVASVWKQ